MTLDATRRGLYDRLREDGFNDPLSQALSGLLAPCVRLSSVRAMDDEISVGESKLGGAPDLASGTLWPDDEGTPMNFIAQLRIEDLRRCETGSDLPSGGLLSFFYASQSNRFGLDPEDLGAWAVRLSPAEGLVRTETPEGVARDGGKGAFSACRVHYWPGYSAPCRKSPQLQAFGLSFEQWSRYFDAWVEYAPGPQMHQVLGYAMPIQDAMEEDCQAAIPSPEGVAGWRSLAQIHADENAGINWGDVGCLYFWIRQSDLERSDFSKCWMVSQCH